MLPAGRRSLTEPQEHRGPYIVRLQVLPRGGVYPMQEDA